jgi:hypothetical protein
LTIFGMLRIKNENRWIREVLLSALPLCERIFVLDDHSTDSTDEFCEQLNERITVIRSKFEGIDESRDKEFLLQRVMGSVSDIHLSGDERSPYWALMIDGDELLDAGAGTHIRSALANGIAHAYKLPIRYLWDSDLSAVNATGQRRVRVDGVYREFARPSIFRLMNSAFRFQKTPWGGNFHCSSIPQELLHCAHSVIPGAPIWHLGYNYRADRIRKFHWYNEIDPNNLAEDRYLHMVQGDLSEVPPHAKLKHAGPLHIETM